MADKYENIVGDLFEMIYDPRNRDWERIFAQGIGQAVDTARNDLLEAQIYRGASDGETVASFLDFCNRYDVPDDLVAKFNDGIFMHLFLLLNNYHRVHASVSGKVVIRYIIPGDFYLQVTADEKQQVLLPPPRRIMTKPNQAASGDRDVEAQDCPGYQWNQVCGMWVFDTTGSKDIDIGHVVLFTVDMAQISSVYWNYEEAKGQEGTDVEKGDELGLLQYGGSDYILLFEKNKVYFDEEEGSECLNQGFCTYRGKLLSARFNCGGLFSPVFSK
ncbi:hypothetical protein BO94DRAFT_591312 [Aspergillus sclerotioniger CBS 115572]|uniref:Uncharacterized protein n=1 Tax=Aspergillus sclerotioniger CBS 115572 TaxID=1450535 RepID=A0A317UW90_9EURO|nr:hypothetical protein BO94DRAFT_591312 [Aspergillus sclerotioniger CBS 115572]PWY65661.1 hypothetical protein BO94DRAFT_591312 [Aspergillus sclerotioniger CBS 115572]